MEQIQKGGLGSGRKKKKSPKQQIKIDFPVKQLNSNPLKKYFNSLMTRVGKFYYGGEKKFQSDLHSEINIMTKNKYGLKDLSTNQYKTLLELHNNKGTKGMAKHPQQIMKASKYGEGKKVMLVANKTKTGKTFLQKRTVGTQNKPKNWFDKYKIHNLNVYPVGLKEKDVKVNLKGDLNTHWVLKWIDPNTKRLKLAYTREFLKNNAENKWNRISNITQKDIEKIKAKTISILKDVNASDKQKQMAAVINIISNTGLRVGDVNNFVITGNRGVTTLHPDNVEIKNDVLKFNFIGKSYQENNASIKNKILADFIKEKKEKGGEFIFDVNRKDVDNFFKSDLKMSGYKIKDLRTYLATEKALDILNKESKSILPLSEDNKQVKKQIKLIFKNVAEKVSDYLNNTPAMAMNSYIHPNVFNTFLLNIGLTEQIFKSVDENAKELTMQDCFKKFPIKKDFKEHSLLIEDWEEEELDFIYYYPNMFDDDIEKSEKHIEWKQITRQGSTFMQRYHKKIDESIEKPSKITDNEYTNLKTRLLFSYFVEGEIYDSNGKLLNLTEDEKEFAKNFHKKQNLRRDLGALYLAAKDKGEVNFSNKDLTEQELAKYRKIFDKKYRQHFIEIVKPKIDANEKQKQDLEKLKDNKQKRHIDLDRIKSRIKDTLKKMNEGYSFKPSNLMRENIKGINIEQFKNVLSLIKPQFKQDITINYTISGQKYSDKISSVLERLQKRIELNNKENKKVWYKSEPESRNFEIPMNKKPIDLKIDDIEGLSDMKLSDFNMENVVSVNYKNFNLKNKTKQS